VADLQIPALSEFGLAQADLSDLVAKAQRSSSMQGNPLTLTPSELHAIAEQALLAP